MPFKSALAAVSALALCAGVAYAQPASSPAPSPIDPARLSAHIKVLASDAFEGRGPGTPGETKAVDYISRQYAALGLQPAGDHGGWTQAVPLNRFEVTGPVAASFRTPAGVRPLVHGEQVTLHTLIPTAHVSIKDAPLVFVGYGVKAPERRWDDFKGADLRGKVLVVLINDPDRETGPDNPITGRFDGKSMTYYGRWTYKYEEAARQGAIAMLIVHETGPAAYGWATVKNSNTIPQFDVVRPDPSKAHPLVEGWVQRDVAVDLFKAAGLDFEAQKKASQSEAFRPVPLKGATFSADYAVNAQQVITHNVVGRIPGATRPDETLIYSAHWDHLGIGPPDARGDRIYNGALDNASGVAAMLELARAFKAGPPPKRSVVFIGFTAEEKGLLGSEYYALHPLFPLAKTVADLNLDGINAVGPARDVSIQGDGKSELDDLLATYAVKQGRRFTPDPHLEDGHFYRADHFELAKVGVPAITLESGLDQVNGGLTAGEAARKDYTTHRYHQPADEWRADWDLRGAAQDLGLYYTLGRDLADGGAWPGWKPTSEFKAARDATAAERAAR